MVKGGVRYSAAGFHSLLVPIDLSPASDRVVGRVAHLPLAEGCRITLLHVISMDLPVRDRKRAEVAARKVLRAEAQELGRQLPRGVALQSVVAQGAAATEIARYATSVKAELVVMGRCGGDRHSARDGERRYGGSVLRDVFLGSTAERVIRRGQLPVLAVRLRARTPYRHPALALDIDQAANESVAMLLRIIPPKRPPVTVIHAFDVPHYGMLNPGMSTDDAEEYNDEYREKALHEIAALLRKALLRSKAGPDDAPIWKAHIRYGTPRLVIERTVRRTDTDLLVLGTRGRSGAAYLFLGTVAGDVLRNVACDVLVVPPRRQPSRKKGR